MMICEQEKNQQMSFAHFLQQNQDTRMQRPSPWQTSAQTPSINSRQVTQCHFSLIVTLASFKYYQTLLVQHLVPDFLVT